MLIDPEKCTDEKNLLALLEKAKFAKVDYLFVGGSTVTREKFVSITSYIKEHTSIPVVIFPGASQLNRVDPYLSHRELRYAPQDEDRNRQARTGDI